MPCTSFQILAAYEEKGIESGTDGILGLSPNREQQNQNFHLLWKLKQQNIIPNAMISFSITSLEQNIQPYAVFGGYNTAQIVGGFGGLHFEKVKPNHLNTWALEG